MYSIKPWFVSRLRGVEERLVRRGVSADALSTAAVVVALSTGAVIGARVRWLWLAVPVLVLVRLACNALDGSIARRSGTARPAGAVLNELGDRLADVFTIGALAFVAGPALAMGALAAAFAASAVGVLAQALTGVRDNAGSMGKADRQAVVALAATGAAIVGSTFPFVLGAIAIAVGSLVTAVARALRLRRSIGATDSYLAEVTDFMEARAGDPYLTSVMAFVELRRAG